MAIIAREKGTSIEPKTESNQQGIYSFPFSESNLKEPPGGLERKEVYRSGIGLLRYGEYPRHQLPASNSA